MRVPCHTVPLFLVAFALLVSWTLPGYAEESVTTSAETPAVSQPAPPKRRERTRWYNFSRVKPVEPSRTKPNAFNPYYASPSTINQWNPGGSAWNSHSDNPPGF
jgi:hypothetical protein